MKKRTRLNCQGLARKDLGLMTCILPDDGWVTVSEDLASGEPTVTSHYSQDKNYMYACFDGVGKAPEYRNHVLMIDDIYLMSMSISPVGAQKMREAFGRRWPAGSFQDQWLADAEVIKKDLKKDRQLHKILCLGLSYGMGPKKAVKTLYEQGYILSQSDAKKFHGAYWHLFSGVKRLADRLGATAEEDGYIVNPFGYRLVVSPFKAFNAFIQSSVSGIMHVYTAKIMAQAPYCRFVTCIHDELILDCPSHLVDRFKIDSQLATQSLNDDLKWTVNIRTGFAVGSNWYEAK